MMEDTGLTWMYDDVRDSKEYCVEQVFSILVHVVLPQGHLKKKHLAT